MSGSAALANMSGSPSDPSMRRLHAGPDEGTVLLDLFGTLLAGVHMPEVCRHGGEEGPVPICSQPQGVCRWVGQCSHSGSAYAIDSSAYAIDLSVVGCHDLTGVTACTRYAHVPSMPKYHHGP